MSQRRAAHFGALAVMLKFTALVATCLAIAQAVDSPPDKFGSVGRELTAEEVSQITGLANAAGKPPWLIIGFRSMSAGVATVTVYLRQDIVDVPVQRGVMQRLIADEPRPPAQRSLWRLKDTGSYAYIAAAAEQRDHLADERDVSWPFAVEGDFDDATLISIVTFIRSKPRIPGRGPDQLPNTVAEAPISVVARAGAQIIVALRTGEAQGQRVTLTQTGGEWLITRVEEWIV